MISIPLPFKQVIFLLKAEGTNGKLGDMDVTTLIANILRREKVDFTFDETGTFKEYNLFNKINNFFKKIIIEFSRIIASVLNSFGVDLKLPKAVDLDTTISFWKNTIVGKPNDPHPYFLKYFSFKMIATPFMHLL